jgi:hypothetical protein
MDVFEPEYYTDSFKDVTYKSIWKSVKKTLILFVNPVMSLVLLIASYVDISIWVTTYQCRVMTYCDGAESATDQIATDSCGAFKTISQIAFRCMLVHTGAQISKLWLLTCLQASHPTINIKFKYNISLHALNNGIRAVCFNAFILMLDVMSLIYGLVRFVVVPLRANNYPNEFPRLPLGIGGQLGMFLFICSIVMLL